MPALCLSLAPSGPHVCVFCLNGARTAFTCGTYKEIYHITEINLGDVCRMCDERVKGPNYMRPIQGELQECAKSTSAGKKM